MTDPDADADADESKIERLEKRIAELEKRQSRSALSRRSILAGVLGVGGLAAMGNVSAQQNQVGTIGTQNKRIDLFADEIDANSVTGARQACRVFLSSSQSISPGARAKVQFDSEVYDSDNNFDTISHDWTCPKDGLYMANLQVRFKGGANDQNRQVLIGTATDDTPSNEGANTRQVSSDTGDILSVSTINKYDSGDTIAGYVQNSNSPDSVRGGSANFETFFEVAFLGGV